MPELPEVETVVRGLQLHLPGREIRGVEFGKTDFVEEPARIEELLPGRQIAEVSRHGKFIVLAVDSAGPGDSENDSAPGRLLFLVHLGMTGQLTVQPRDFPVAPHTHARFPLDNDLELRYTDIRRFGRMLLIAEERREQILGPLGADALEISLADFALRLANRRARIKALLLDQTVFRGMGNIYTDESLWRARIHPARLGAALSPAHVARLHRSLREVLREAIRLRGSSVSDYVDSEGQRGEFQLRHRVYQREGKKCHRCGAKIRRVIVAGRSSYFCPRCQPAPRAAKIMRPRKAKPRRKNRPRGARRKSQRQK